jgi:hypothetical protein
MYNLYEPNKMQINYFRKLYVDESTSWSLSPLGLSSGANTSRRVQGRQTEVCLQVAREVLLYICPLLGNNYEANETAAVARQQPACSNGSSDGSRVFYVVHFEAISCNQLSSVQLAECSTVE